MSANEGTFQLHISTLIAQTIRDLQAQSSLEGRGADFLIAFRTLVNRLELEPWDVGEPVYRLPAMRMQVRCVAIRPLYVDFAVCEDRPLVFLKAVKLLGPGI